jgi:hypothetical protein
MRHKQPLLVRHPVLEPQGLLRGVVCPPAAVCVHNTPTCPPFHIRGSPEALEEMGRVDYSLPGANVTNLLHLQRRAS